MSERPGSAETAFRVADRLRGRLAGPWDVYGERARRFELHFARDRTEVLRGPVEIEGYSVRLVRPSGEGCSVGFAGTSDLSDGALDAVRAAAEENARYSRFPARGIELPSSLPASTLVPPTVDPKLWQAPEERLEALAHQLVEACRGEPGVAPSFGSVRGALVETTIANSAGLMASCARTEYEIEIALKSEGGADGRPDGEFWAGDRLGRVDDAWLRSVGPHWAEMAADARSAQPPSNGPTEALLPPSVLSTILPVALGFRFSAAASLRGLAIAPGTTVASSVLSVDDNGLLPFGLSSAPFDAEGTVHRRVPLIEAGQAAGTLTDRLHAGALGIEPTGNGERAALRFPHWFAFTGSLGPRPTTIVVHPGTGGTQEELLESIGEGLLVEQVGFPNPNEVSGGFGGELRLGYRIHRGQKAGAVRGGIVGDSLFAAAGARSFLSSVKAAGSRSELSGRLSSPPLWIGSLPVGGA